MTVRFPKNSAAASLAERLGEFARNLGDDLDDLLQEQYRAGYQQGFQEGAHEICRDVDGCRHCHANSIDCGRKDKDHGAR